MNNKHTRNNQQTQKPSNLDELGEPKLTDVLRKPRKLSTATKIPLIILGIFILFIIIGTSGDSSKDNQATNTNTTNTATTTAQTAEEAKAAKVAQEAKEAAEREAAAAATRAAEDESIANATSGHSYDDLLRNSSNYKGTYMRFTGAILQTDSHNSYCRVGIKITSYAYIANNYGSDEVLFVSPCKSNAGKLLEDDIVTFIGVGDGTYIYTAVMGNTIELPSVKGISRTFEVIGKN